MGRYVSTAWIPGNLLGEGNYVVGSATLSDTNHIVVHAKETDVVAFQTVDPLEGDSSRGESGGVIRPLLKWTTNLAG